MQNIILLAGSGILVLMVIFNGNNAIDNCTQKHSMDTCISSGVNQ